MLRLNLYQNPGDPFVFVNLVMAQSKIFVLLILFLPCFFGKGMWGARRRRPDDGDAPGRSHMDSSVETPEFHETKVDLRSFQEYLDQTETFLAMAEQFVSSPECTVKKMKATLQASFPEVWDQDAFNQNFPDTKTLRKTLREAIVMSRQVVARLPEMLNSIDDGSLDSPDKIIEYFAASLTPEMEGSLQAILAAIEPYVESFMEVLNENLDPESQAMVETIMDGVLSLSSRSSEADVDVDVSDTINESMKTLLSSITTQKQVRCIRFV